MKEDEETREGGGWRKDIVTDQGPQTHSKEGHIASCRSIDWDEMRVGGKAWIGEGGDTECQRKRGARSKTNPYRRWQRKNKTLPHDLQGENEQGKEEEASNLGG